ncbi:MAG: hypothetical protein JW791_03195 [Nanoarchaeota archaeon]|nr:hypothetical protein [Nanoarchaeota archaeon]
MGYNDRGSSRGGRSSGGFRGDRGSRGGFRSGGRGGFRSGPREMHKAVCSECNKECEVPFKPREDRPVYCKECFAKKRDNSSFTRSEKKEKVEEDEEFEEELEDDESEELDESDDDEE